MQSNKNNDEGSIHCLTSYHEDEAQQLENNCINSISERSQRYYIEKCEYSSECYVTGNNTSFKICDDINEIKADLVIEEYEKINVYGKIKDCRGCAAAFINVILVAVRREGYKCLGETTTNSRGHYRFSVCADNNACEYKILVKRC